MKPGDIPNIITVFRFLLVPPVVVLLLEERFAVALVLFGVAGFSDALDGYLAKRYHWSSRLGALLDPLADKLLLVTVFICLSIAGLVPWWLTALVLLRDLVITFGALTYKMLFGPVRGAPTAASKINTFCQIVFCLAVVSQAAYWWPGTAVVTALGALVAVTTAVSGIDYTLTYSRRAAGVTRARAAVSR